MSTEEKKIKIHLQAEIKQISCKLTFASRSRKYLLLWWKL